MRIKSDTVSTESKYIFNKWYVVTERIVVEVMIFNTSFKKQLWLLVLLCLLGNFCRSLFKIGHEVFVHLAIMKN